MNISVIGTGYVGLVVGACLAETGNSVCCADIDVKKIDGLKQNVLPIYEPGLEALVERNQNEQRLTFTTNLQEAIAMADVVFIAVGTPPGEDGSADLKYVLQVASLIGQHMSREMVVVTKSTVPVGSATKVSAEIAKKAKFPFYICSNPEFLKEGSAIEDFMRPDRVVIGVVGGPDRFGPGVAAVLCLRRVAWAGCPIGFVGRHDDVAAPGCPPLEAAEALLAGLFDDLPGDALLFVVLAGGGPDHVAGKGAAALLVLQLLLVKCEVQFSVPHDWLTGWADESK